MKKLHLPKKVGFSSSFSQRRGRFSFPLSGNVARKSPGASRLCCYPGVKERGEVKPPRGFDRLQLER